MINWKLRIKNKAFWVTLFPALGVLAQAIAYPFFPDLDLSGVTAWLIGIVNAVFAVLAILGIVADTSTQGISDTEKSMKAKTPKMNARQLKRK